MCEGPLYASRFRHDGNILKDLGCRCFKNFVLNRIILAAYLIKWKWKTLLEMSKDGVMIGYSVKPVPHTSYLTSYLLFQTGLSCNQIKNTFSTFLLLPLAQPQLPHCCISCRPPVVRITLIVATKGVCSWSGGWRAKQGWMIAEQVI